MQAEIFLELLTEHKIEYDLYTHRPLYTTKEAREVEINIPGAHSKNLFLKDRKGKLFLLSVLEHKSVDLKKLSKQYGRGGLSFAAEDLLMQHLGVKPGSVSPYGLINDKEQKVHFLLDQDFTQYEKINFHPLCNTKTITVLFKDFLQLAATVLTQPELLVVPERC